MQYVLVVILTYLTQFYRHLHSNCTQIYLIFLFLKRQIKPRFIFNDLINIIWINSASKYNAIME